MRGEIESLLGAHGAADADFMDTLADPVLSEVPGEQEGDSIGRYKLRDQTEPVKRRVALKAIKAGMDSKEVIAHFDTKARLALFSDVCAAVQHAHQKESSTA